MQGEFDAAPSTREADTSDALVDSGAAESVAEIAAPLVMCPTLATALRERTKIASVLGLLQRNEGATLEIIATRSDRMARIFMAIEPNARH